MDLQSLFYLVSIVAIIGWLVFLLIILFGSVLIFKRLNRMTKTVEKKVDSTAASVLLPLLPIGLFILSEFKKRFGGK